MSESKERLDAINRVANNLGQTLLTVCEGDWDLALSISVVLFSSCCAQVALESGDNVQDLFDGCGVSAHKATMAFYNKFKDADDEAEG